MIPLKGLISFAVALLRAEREVVGDAAPSLLLFFGFFPFSFALLLPLF
jgi:hypothetical protein